MKIEKLEEKDFKVNGSEYELIIKSNVVLGNKINELVEAHNQKEELDEVLLVDNSNTEPKKNWTYKELTEQVILKERARIKKEILEMPWHEDYTSGLRETYLKRDDILKLL